MLPKIVIEQVIASQKLRIEQLESGMKRYVGKISGLSSHALIISGIRRCGKSTLLRQILNSGKYNSIYLNFEDPRLTGFDAGDYNRLREIASLMQTDTFFFDEIQNTSGWEQFTRFSLDEKYKVFITGSNAKMLSKELGTKLTGRHLSLELFPFSYQEYLDFTDTKADAGTTAGYLKNGGFPEMLKTGLPEILMQVFNDIVIRDIAVRHNIKNILTLQQLAVWLISNPGKLISGNNLRKIFAIGSSASIMEYLSFFNDAYLFFFVPKFSYSQKVQIVNPKKVYAIDTGLVNVNSTSFSDDLGRVFENLVFLHLRRQTREIFYFSEEKECDFVIFKKGRPASLYQVCLELNSDNMSRELDGLAAALDFFNIDSGIIVTMNQADTFKTGNKTITAMPFHEWALLGSGT
jgi:uncharacterized protein